LRNPKVGVDQLTFKSDFELLKILNLNL